MFDFFKKLFSNQIEENSSSETNAGTLVVVENPGGADANIEKIQAQGPDKTTSARRRTSRPERTRVTVQ